MILPRPCQPERLAVLAATALCLASCATVPPQQVTTSGTVPAGRSYAVLQPVKDAPPLPALARLEPCLGAAGLQPVPAGRAGPPEVLVQAAYVLRPARSVLLRAGEEPPRKGHAPARKRDREELALTLTERETGTVLWHGAVVRVLGKAEGPGDGAALATPLCAALTGAPAAGSR